MKRSSPASFCPPSTIPSLAACVIELIVSPPALARPMTFALEACAYDRKGEKSAVSSGARIEPRTQPPFCLITFEVSRSRS